MKIVLWNLKWAKRNTDCDQLIFQKIMQTWPAI